MNSPPLSLTKHVVTVWLPWVCRRAIILTGKSSHLNPSLIKIKHTLIPGILAFHQGCVDLILNNRHCSCPIVAQFCFIWQFLAISPPMIENQKNHSITITVVSRWHQAVFSILPDIVQLYNPVFPDHHLEKRPWLQFEGEKKWNSLLKSIKSSMTCGFLTDMARPHAWMPAMILMQYWDISLWCSQLPRGTLGILCVAADGFTRPFIDFSLWLPAVTFTFHTSYLGINGARGLMWVPKFKFPENLQPLVGEGQSSRPPQKKPILSLFTGNQLRWGLTKIRRDTLQNIFSWQNQWCARFIMILCKLLTGNANRPFTEVQHLILSVQILEVSYLSSTYQWMICKL